MNTTNPFDILGWLWVILFVALWLKRIFWRWMNGARAVNWPVTDGSVHSASGPPFGTIHYSYKVADSYYSGMFWRKENGHVEASDLRARSLKVRYKPETPEISFLLKSDQPDLLD